jgi:hypothetical protein
VYTANGDYAGTEMVPASGSGTGMSYGQQMSNVGGFVGNLAIGGAKGFVNQIPETAALAYRMTGYAAAGLVSLVNTDASDQMFAQYGQVTGRVLDYSNDVQEVGGILGQLASPAVVRGAYVGGARLYEVEQRLGGSIDTARGISGLGSPARGEPLRRLDSDEILQVGNTWAELGGDVSKLKFNQGIQTGVGTKSGNVYIRGDVFPSTSGSLHPTANLSVRETLSHEMGHINYADTGVAAGAWNDEFRASYWASKNVPGLTFEERSNLVIDAYQRATDAGVPIRMNSYMRQMIYGY